MTDLQKQVLDLLAMGENFSVRYDDVIEVHSAWVVDTYSKIDERFLKRFKKSA